MTDTIEIDYEGDEELHAVVCRPPSGHLYIHLTDEPGEIHGAETTRVDGDQTAYIPEGMINDVDG